MSKLKEYTKHELSELVDKRNLHLLIRGKVYDVHGFINEHPGGDLVMLGAGGEDATKAWEDIQHSEEAQEMMQRYLVGYCPEAQAASRALKSAAEDRPKSRRSVRTAILILVAVFLAVGFGLYRRHL